jgi:hypothetical protein
MQSNILYILLLASFPVFHSNNYIKKLCLGPLLVNIGKAQRKCLLAHLTYNIIICTELQNMANLQYFHLFLSLFFSLHFLMAETDKSFKINYAQSPIKYYNLHFYQTWQS